MRVLIDRTRLVVATKEQSVAREAFAAGSQALYRTHPELHHYTDEGGLRGIVENNSLWGTYFEHLNDTREIHRLRETLSCVEY